MRDEADDALEEGAAIDPWSVHLPGRDLVPAYLVSRYAAQYRAIVDVLVTQQDTSLTGLSFDELESALRAGLTAGLTAEVAESLLGSDRFNLDARLTRLEEWRVVTRWQEPARTGEDFLRRRDRYQLTPLAARLHAFWSEAEEDDEAAAGGLTLAPRAIMDRLGSLREALADGAYAAAASEMQQIGTLHQAAAQAARGWQRTLAHAMSGGPDPQKQELLRRTLHAYIGMWGEQVDVYSPRIAELIEQLREQLTEQVWRACARSAFAEDAPEDLVAGQVERWIQTWDALGTWFAGTQGQARRLRRQLRDLVAPWARNMHILMDTGGAVTRRAELLRLAAAIERAPDEHEAWRLWDTAVGIFAARHLMLPSDAAEDQVMPWAAASPAPVTARFREHGTRAAVGRRAKIPDYSAGRTAARRARVAALARRAEAEASLRGRSGSRLGGWGEVTEHELDLLVDLLGVARRGVRGEEQTESYTSVTADGRWRITLTVPGERGQVATLSCARGRLTSVDWLFEMEPAA